MKHVVGLAARSPSLVGRAAELATLRQLVRDVRRSGQIAVIEGEAGIGKTRVVDAAIETAAAAGMTVLSSRAEELETHRAFGAIVEILGQAPLGASRDVRDLEPDVGGQIEFRVAESLLETLDVRCAHSPVLLAVEDLQWADRGTLAVLARVAAGIERLPVLLVVSSRQEPRRPELERLLAVFAAHGAAWVGLAPLGEQFSVELLEELLGARAGPRLASQTLRAGGNPLFVCEFVDALLADSAIVRNRDGAELATDVGGASLPLTILHRLSLLPAELLDLLGLASVLGASFAVADLALLAGRPVAELVPSLRSARRAGLIGVRGERLAFRHELVRDALYHDMSLAVRRSLHGELATALAETGAPIEHRVEHLVRAATPGDERAVESLVDAARELVGRAPGTAVDVYRRAIELSAVSQTRRAELLPELADAMISAGPLDEGEAVCREALAGDLDAQWAGRLRLRLILLSLQRGRPAEAVADGEDGLADPEIAGRDRMRLEALVSMARVFSGDVERAVRAAQVVLQSSDDEYDRAIVTNTLAIAAAGRGAFAEAAELAVQTVQWAERTGAGFAWDTRPHLTLGPVLVSLDRLDEAYATVQRGRRGTERLGIANEFGYHLQAGFIDFMRGRLDDALAELSTGAQLAEHAVGWRVSGESVRALVAIHRDDLLVAARHVAVAEQGAASAPAPGLELLLLARTRLLDATGDAAAEVDALVDAFESLAEARAATYLPLLGPDLARVAVVADRPARASSVVAELWRIAELNPGVHSLEASALHTRGLADSDADSLLTAIDLLRDTGRVLHTARAAEDAANLAVGRAADLLVEARQIYERCGATRDVARVDAAQRRRGVRRGVSGPRRRPATGWEALTDTELTVVRLVAERLTNPEIADRMFISRRTVQTHVSHALAKLGVATRRDLAAAATRQAGWLLRVEGVGEQAEQH